MDKNKTLMESSLKTKDLVIYGLVFMIPIAPLAIYGTLLKPSSGMVALCYLIGMAAMSFTGLSYRKMAEKFPYAGSAYVYIQKGANPFWGFVAGWAILLDYFLLPATVLIIGSSFAHFLLPAIPKYAWIILFILFSTIINIVGVNIMSKLSWILFGLQITVLFIFILCTIRLLLTNTINWNVVAFYNPQDFHWSGIFQATGIVILSYLGFDAIGTLAEEAIEPRKSVGKAIILSILIIGFLFVVTTFFAGLAYPNYKQLNSDDAFLKIIEFVGGYKLTVITVITIVLSFAVATCQASQAAVARILYAMGRDEVLPKKLAYLDPKLKTPVISLIIVALVVTPLAIVCSLEYISLMVSFGALVSFLLLNATVIWNSFITSTEQRSASNIIQNFLFPLIGICINFWILINLKSTAHIVGLSWLAIELIYVFFLTKGFKNAIPEFELK